MLFKKPPHRIFDYTPRYYNPENDETEKRKKHLKFRYHRQMKRKTKSPLIWLVLLLAILFFYLKFSGVI